MENEKIEIESRIGQWIFKYCKKQVGYKTIKISGVSWIRKTSKGYVVYFPKLGYKKSEFYIR